MGKMRRIPGGHLRAANRWFDAGYAYKAPHAASLVYLFLNRWTDNETGIVEQTIGAITRHSGVRTERMVREALAGLELWGVITPLPREYQNSTNRWCVNDLEKRAPDYPSKDAIKAYRRSTPAPSEGVKKANAPAPSEGVSGSGDGQGGSNPGTAHTPSVTAPSAPTPIAPTPSDTALGGTPYHAIGDQAIGDQAIGDQAMPIIACSGAEAPTHPAQPSADARARHDFVDERATDTDWVGAPSCPIFQLWWKSYPGTSDVWQEFYRGACIAWNQLRPSEDLGYEMVNAINAQTLWPEYQREDGPGLPNPAKWLRDERWRDEPLGGWPDDDDDGGYDALSDWEAWQALEDDNDIPF